MTSDVKLHYFHGRGIGELIRLLLTVGEVKFTEPESLPNDGKVIEDVRKYE